MKAFKDKMRPYSLVAVGVLMASLAFSNSAKSDVISDAEKITGDLKNIRTPAELDKAFKTVCKQVGPITDAKDALVDAIASGSRKEITEGLNGLGLSWPPGTKPSEAQLNGAAKLAVTETFKAQLEPIETMITVANIACDPEAAAKEAVAQLKNVGNVILDVSSSLGVDAEKDVLPV
jgi:hypothetical protein